MTAGPGTEVRPCCSMCLIVPASPAALEKRLEFVPYYLCTDRTACLDRATAQQHEAAEAVRRAVAAEKAALEADPAGKHAATGPLQAITDAGAQAMTEAAKDAPADGEAGDD